MPTKKKIKKKSSRSKRAVAADKPNPNTSEIVTADRKSSPSISASVRRLVVSEPQLIFAEISARLVNDGWNSEEIERRKSTIATLRADTLAILAIAREQGWRAPSKRR